MLHREQLLCLKDGRLLGRVWYKILSGQLADLGVRMGDEPHELPDGRQLLG